MIESLQSLLGDPNLPGGLIVVGSIFGFFGLFIVANIILDRQTSKKIFKISQKLGWQKTNSPHQTVRQLKEQYPFISEKYKFEVFWGQVKKIANKIINDRQWELLFIEATLEGAGGDRGQASTGKILCAITQNTSPETTGDRLQRLRSKAQENMPRVEIEIFPPHIIASSVIADVDLWNASHIKDFLAAVETISANL